MFVCGAAVTLTLNVCMWWSCDFDVECLYVVRCDFDVECLHVVEL